MTTAAQPIHPRRGRLASYWRDIASFPRDAVRLWRVERWHGVVRLIVARTVNRVFYTKRFHLIEQTLHAVPPRRPLPSGRRVTRLGDDDWDALACLATSRQIEMFCRRIAAGRRCYVAWDGTEAVGYVWVSTTIETAFEGFAIDLPPHAWYGWDLYVTPRRRREGIATMLILEGLHISRDMGWMCSYRLIAPENVGSLRTLEKTSGGHRTLATVRRTKLFHREFYRVHPADGAASEPTP